MRIVRARRIGSSTRYLVYPNAYQPGEMYLEVVRWLALARKTLALNDRAKIRDSQLITVNGSLLFTYYLKESAFKQGLELTCAGWRWRCIALGMDRRRDKTDQRSTLYRASYMRQAVERIAHDEKLGPTIRSLQPASRENVELRATMFAVLREVADLVRGLGLSASDWEMYPPSIRKARRMLGLPHKGKIHPEEIDPLAELRNWHESFER